MISIILSSRVKNNPNSNIHRLLRSIQSCGGDMKNCEGLIKYDSDDDEQNLENHTHKDNENYNGNND